MSRNSQIRSHLWLLVLALWAPVGAEELQLSSPSQPARVGKRDANDALSKVLSPGEWRRLDAAVDRALMWLAAQQQPDGSFPTLTQGQPGVTSLCVLAF